MLPGRKIKIGMKTAHGAMRDNYIRWDVRAWTKLACVAHVCKEPRSCVYQQSELDHKRDYSFFLLIIIVAWFFFFLLFQEHRVTHQWQSTQKISSAWHLEWHFKLIWYTVFIHCGCISFLAESQINVGGGGGSQTAAQSNQFHPLFMVHIYLLIE